VTAGAEPGKRTLCAFSRRIAVLAASVLAWSMIRAAGINAR
jgi:hypothetical protein